MNAISQSIRYLVKKLTGIVNDGWCEMGCHVDNLPFRLVKAKTVVQGVMTLGCVAVAGFLLFVWGYGFWAFFFK